MEDQATAATVADEDDDDCETVLPHVALPPIHPEHEAIWRQRAREYNSAYPGPDHWRRALNTLAACGSLPLALREANISRKAFNLRRERYPEFAEACDDAQEFFRSRVIEVAAVTRGIDGWLEPVFHKGALVGHVRRFSDAILGRLMEGNLGDKYRHKSDVNLNASGEFFVAGGLPEMPLTAADVPVEYRHLVPADQQPQQPAQQPTPQLEPPKSE